MKFEMQDPFYRFKAAPTRLSNFMGTVEENLIAEADLHFHLLPGWDDGPQILDESLRLAAKAEAAGIRRILVTPHVGRSFGGRPERAAEDIPAAVAHLQAQLLKAGISLELASGAELTLSPDDLVQRIAKEPWLSFGGARRYVLVESPIHIWPDWADEILFELSRLDITPIIAHPERLSDVQKDLTPMRRAVERGALLQVTARSLVGRERATKECSRRLFEAGLVALVASDAHSEKHLMIGEARTHILDLISEDAARQILVENPRAILAGDLATSPGPRTRPENTKGVRGLARQGRAVSRSLQRLWQGP